MQQYKDLIQDVLDNGIDSDDRTGTGTKSVFGRQVRFDLSKGFPLVTLKKTYWKGVVIELLWLLRGETNIAFLKKHGVTIWDEWADENGDLGPVYGSQWRGFRGVVLNDIKIFEKPTTQGVGNIHGVGRVENLFKHTKDPLRTHLYQTWYAILKRCYNPKHAAYENYGGRGIFVDDRWLIFENFLEDVKKLDNWILKREYPSEYSLDKDFYGSNKYGPDTCRWSSKIEQSTNTRSNTNIFVATDPSGYSTIEYGLRPFCDKYNICKPSVSQVLKGVYKSTDGWSFTKAQIPDNKVCRLVQTDQIKKIIAEIKHSANSRRIIVNAWHVTDLPRMALEPCHCFFQFYVRNGKLSCQLYQRSADLFLGVPFNIASYALLTHLIAEECGLGVGEFIHTFGDLHLYNNHLDQAREVLKREPLPLPTLITRVPAGSLMDFIDKECKDMAWEEIQSHSIELIGYDSHPAIRADVSV
jgi:thymidylate synthase